MPTSTGVIQHVPGETVTLVLALTDDEDRTNEPVTSQSPTVAVRRTSDDKWWDFVASAWDVVASYGALGAEHKQALTDKSDGSYEYDFDQATIDASAERTYEMAYAVPAGNYQGMTYETWVFTSEDRDAILDDATRFSGADIDSILQGVEDVLHTNWTHLYVDKGGNDANDGSTWPLAFLTIQAAIDAAAIETVITVGTGFYTENVTINVDRIILRAHDWDIYPFKGPTVTIQSAAADNHTLTIGNNQVQVIGFYIYDYNSGSADGISIDGCENAAVYNCRIYGVNGFLRDGIRVHANSIQASIIGVRIQEARRYGIQIDTSRNAYIRDCSIGVTTGATAAFAITNEISGVGIEHCNLYTLAAVADGINFGASSVNCRAIHCAVAGFTNVYTDDGTDNEFIFVHKVTTPASDANQQTILNRIGAFTGTGVNTILGFFLALFRSDAATPSDIGGTPDPATDSLEAIRDRGDTAWTTGGGSIILSAESLELTITGGEVVDDDGSIAVTRDDDTDIQWTWTDHDIEGYTIYMTVRSSLTEDEDADDSDALFQLEAALTTPGSGVFTFTIGKAQTDECTVGTKYWYDVCAFDGDGNITTLVKAPFEVTGDATRRLTIA